MLRVILAVALVSLPLAAAAGNGNGKAKGHGSVTVLPSPGISPVHCPPGLAKKNPPCVPPGQAKKYYRTGDYLRDGYTVIGSPHHHGLRRHGYYVQAGGYVYEIDRDTHKVLTLIGAVADILQ